MIVTISPLDELLANAPDDDNPLTEADLQSIRDLNLTSCDFVGDSGCCDPDCWQCHSPIGPENLRRLAANIAAAAMLCRAWQLREGDPAWYPGCKLDPVVADPLTE